MSWFFGIYGNINPDVISKAKNIHGPALFRHKYEKIYLTAGGLEETCLAGEAGDGRKFYICGSGINKNERGIYRFTDTTDWSRIISDDLNNINDLQGHFAGVAASENIIEMFTDRLGIRNVFYSKAGGNHIFSTRIDFIAKFLGGCKLNLKSAATEWMLNTSLTHESFLTNIVRYSSGARIKIDRYGINATQSFFIPEDKRYEKDKLEADLKNFCNLPSEENSRVIIPLSGGIDSRLILSLLKEDQIQYTATFGDPEHPDSKVANDISAAMGPEHRQFNDEIPWPEAIYDDLAALMTRYPLTFPASQILFRRYLGILYEPGTVVLDGGFGLIMRRGFFNKLFFHGKSLIGNRQYIKIYNLLFSRKADIFKDEFNAELRRNAISGIEEAISGMPAPDEYAYGKWLDLLAARYRLPNYSAIDQARSDELIHGFTPYQQPEIISAAMNIPFPQKLNAGLMKSLIKRNSEILLKYPLVKKNGTVPFHLPGLFSSLLMKINPGNSAPLIPASEFLLNFKEFIYDRISSRSFREYELYDLNKIQNIADGYYSGNLNLQRQMDNFLGFEILRSEMLTS